MLRFYNLLYTVAFILGFCATMSAEALAQTAQANAASATLDANQRQWLLCIDVLLDGADRADRVGNACHRRIFDMARMQYSEEGVDAFLDEVLSAKSQLGRILDEGDWYARIREQFLKHLFAPLEYKRFLIAALARCDEEMLSVQEQTLIQLGLDVDFTPSHQMPKSLDLSAIDKSVNEAIKVIEPVIEAANIAGTNRAIVGFHVGNDVGNRFADSMRDQNGDLSWAGFFGSVAVGAAAERLGNSAIERVTHTFENTRAYVDSAAVNVVRDCTENKRPVAAQEIGHMLQLLKAHEVEIALVIIDYLGVDRAWAFETYNARVQARAAK